MTLLSYCGLERSWQVRQEIQHFKLGSYFEDVQFTWSKTGPKGKARACQRLGLTCIFDDNPDIITECKQLGVYAYAINTPKCFHIAGHDSFAAAVKQFLVDEK